MSNDYVSYYNIRIKLNSLYLLNGLSIIADGQYQQQEPEWEYKMSVYLQTSLRF